MEAHNRRYLIRRNILLGETVIKILASLLYEYHVRVPRVMVEVSVYIHNIDHNNR